MCQDNTGLIPIKGAGNIWNLLHMQAEQRRLRQDSLARAFVILYTQREHLAVILLPVHPASFAHNFVSGMQSFYFSESQDAIILQTCH